MCRPSPVAVAARYPLERADFGGLEAIFRGTATRNLRPFPQVNQVAAEVAATLPVAGTPLQPQPLPQPPESGKV